MLLPTRYRCPAGMTRMRADTLCAVACWQVTPRLSLLPATASAPRLQRSVRCRMPSAAGVSRFSFSSTKRQNLAPPRQALHVSRLNQTALCRPHALAAEQHALQGTRRRCRVQASTASSTQPKKCYTRMAHSIVKSLLPGLQMELTPTPLSV